MKVKQATAAKGALSRDLQVRTAWLYYVAGLTQLEISRTLKLSRAKVIRLLAAARDGGVVRIHIDATGSEQIALERDLVARYGLSDAIVVPAPNDDTATAAAVGHAAGVFIADRIHDGTSIGVGWGSTLETSLKAIGRTPCEGVSVVSLLGGMTHSRPIDPSSVARRLADALGADCYQLTAPMFVTEETLRAALWAEPGLRELRDRARRVDLALVSGSDISEDATLFREGLLPRSQVASLVKAGAVGEVLCHFIDAEGRAVDHPLNRRAIAVDLQDLRRVPTIVLAAGGRRRVGAIRAAFKAMAVGVLITDEAAARGLLI